jgi:hypothetical protein
VLVIAANGEASLDGSVQSDVRDHAVNHHMLGDSRAISQNRKARRNPSKKGGPAAAFRVLIARRRENENEREREHQ